MATHRFSIPKTFYYWPLIGLWLSTVALAVSFYALIPISIFAYFTFRNTLNILQVVGPIYWISRDYDKVQKFRIGSGFMHTISDPWFKGKGVQISLWKRSFQVGICQEQKYHNDLEGSLAAIQGRFLDLTPRQIREQSESIRNK